VWSWPSQAEGAAADSTLLTDFVSLADTDDERILAFARRWGMLNICEHGLPIYHPWIGERRRYPCDWLDVDGSRKVFWEPLAAWRRYAAEARALIKLSRRLHRGRLGELHDWQEVPGVQGTAYWETWSEAGHVPEDSALLLIQDNWAFTLDETKLGRDVAFERRCLARSVEKWASDGGVKPILDWDGAKPRIELEGGGLFGALAVELLQAVGYPDTLAICDGCGKAFIPAMRPSTSRRNYCKDCGHRAAIRDAARRYRQRKRASNDAQTDALTGGLG
jgi:DNA-directed RNA polymerase subunit RPC12/RpoP